MKTLTAVAITLPLLASVISTGRAQSVKPLGPSAPTPLATLAKALSGKWQLQVRFEPAGVTGSKAIAGSGEESWSLGPGGINLIEQEHIPSPYGQTFLMGVIWWDSTEKQLAGMECNSHLSFTCDLKGALNDITMTWDGKRFEIDEIETHDGKRTVWHEVLDRHYANRIRSVRRRHPARRHYRTVHEHPRKSGQGTQKSRRPVGRLRMPFGGGLR